MHDRLDKGQELFYPAFACHSGTAYHWIKLILRNELWVPFRLMAMIVQELNQFTQECGEVLIFTPLQLEQRKTPCPKKNDCSVQECKNAFVLLFYRSSF